jgi:hypothetical protein
MSFHIDLDVAHEADHVSERKYYRKPSRKTYSNISPTAFRPSDFSNVDDLHRELKLIENL